MNNILIYGAGRFGHQVLSLIINHYKDKLSVIGFIDDVKKPGTKVTDDLFVLGGYDFLKESYKNSAAETSIFIGIGYNDLPQRNERYSACKELGFRLPNLIHPAAILESNVQVGGGNFIHAGAVIDHSVSIGNINFIDIGCLISHENQIGDNNFLTAGMTTAGFVKIGNSNFIGMNATIVDKVNIGSNNFINANSLVTRNITDNKKAVTFYDQKIIEIA